MRWTGMDCSHMAQDREANSTCKHGSRYFDYVKSNKILDPLRKY